MGEYHIPVLGRQFDQFIRRWERKIWPRGPVYESLWFQRIACEVIVPVTMAARIRGVLGGDAILSSVSSSPRISRGRVANSAATVAGMIAHLPMISLTATGRSAAGAAVRPPWDSLAYLGDGVWSVFPVLALYSVADPKLARWLIMGWIPLFSCSLQPRQIIAMAGLWVFMALLQVVFWRSDGLPRGWRSLEHLARQRGLYISAIALATFAAVPCLVAAGLLAYHHERLVAEIQSFEASCHRTTGTYVETYTQGVVVEVDGRRQLAPASGLTFEPDESLSVCVGAGDNPKIELVEYPRNPSSWIGFALIPLVLFVAIPRVAWVADLLFQASKESTA